MYTHTHTHGVAWHKYLRGLKTTRVVIELSEVSNRLPIIKTSDCPKFSFALLTEISGCPFGQVAIQLHLPEHNFHLPRAIGQPLMSIPAENRL